MAWLNKDTVVGILGAVILVAAMVGIFYYEGTQAPGATAAGPGAGPLALTWDEVQAAGPTLASAGALAEGASEEGEVTVDAANLTRAVFTLTWTDDVDQSAPDTFRLTVTPPEGLGEPQTAEGSGGSVSVTFAPINPVPSAERGSAADLATLASTNGSGVWRVTVEMLNAGDVGEDVTGVPVPGAVPVADTGNSWSLATQLTSYAAEARAA